MARWTDLKPEDMVRCFRCKRLARKELSVVISGQWYGSDCAAQAYMTAAAPFTCMTCGHPRTADDMATFDMCKKCDVIQSDNQET